MGDAGQALRFGAYPWGGVGAIDQVAGSKPDDPARAMATVKELQGGRQFVVHLYGDYTGTNLGEADHLMSDARWWSDNGVGVEVVLRYRPTTALLGVGFTPWVRSVAARLAALRGTVAIQIGNEANNTASAAAADGAYAGAVRQIARAIPAARDAVRATGRTDVGIGFNWAADGSPCTTTAFWGDLRAAGGAQFTDAVDWVGVDVYPGTWSAPARGTTPTPAAVADTITSTLRCLRQKHLPAAGLGASTTITVAETGYPTAPGRSEATQTMALRTIVQAVSDVRAAYGVTDLRWFSMRDANTGSGEIENGYGLLRDDYSRKPAFAAFRDVVAATGR
jgi:hypothetical protein